jgi:protein SCO1/2
MFLPRRPEKTATASRPVPCLRPKEGTRHDAIRRCGRRLLRRRQCIGSGPDTRKNRTDRRPVHSSRCRHRSTFRDEEGRSVALAQYFGQKPVILALVYYRCPMLCTMVLNDLTRSLNALEASAGDQFTVLAVSFDPAETPDLATAKKDQYLRAYRRPHAEQGWHFLTGPQESIARLAAAVGFRYAWDAKNQQWAHASGLVILTPSGHISRYFYGIDYAPTDLRLALAEAGEQKISPSASTRVLLYCFHYDPSTGRFGLAIMRLLQTGGILTLLLLGGSIWLTIRRDRRVANRVSTMSAAMRQPNPGDE